MNVLQKNVTSTAGLRSRLRVFSRLFDDENVADGKSVQRAIARGDRYLRRAVALDLEHARESLSGQDGKAPSAKRVRCRRCDAGADRFRLERVDAPVAVRIAERGHHARVPSKRWVDDDIVMAHAN